MLNEQTIIRNRHAAAIAWSAIATCVLLTGISGIPQLGLVTWIGTIVLLVITARRQQPMREEQLVRSRAYHTVAGAVFGVAVVGCVMGMLPGAAERSQLLAVFFGVTAVLAYRALVARGPNPTMLLAVITAFTWLPGMLVLVVHCKCGHHEANWIETVSHSLFVSVLVLVGALVAVSLLAFRRRTTDLPDARIR